MEDGTPPAPVTVVDTEAWVSPAVALGVSGVAGSASGAGPEPEGVMVADAAEEPLVPPAFVAVAVNVYPVPFVSPVTVHDAVRGLPLGAPVVQVWPPDDVTVKDVGAPPEPLSVTSTKTAAFCDVPVGAFGIDGAAGSGVTEEDADDALLVP